MTAVTLRPATAADAGAVTAVFVAARRQMTYLPTLHTDDETARFVADLVADAAVCVAEQAGAVIGFAALRRGWLEHLYVDPVHQRRGVGTGLLEWAKQESPDGLDLWVFQANTGARRLYEAHGFALVVLTDGAANEERLPDAHLRFDPAAPAGPVSPS